VSAITSLGSRIHEHSGAGEFRDDPLRVEINGTVTCADVVIAAHNPLVGIGGVTAASLFRQLALYQLRIAGRVPKTQSPMRCGGHRGSYHYLESSRIKRLRPSDLRWKTTNRPETDTPRAIEA
jgi:hypothetical protein